MAFSHGKDSYFAIDNSAGALTNLILFVDNVDFPQEIDTPETTTYTKQAKTYIVGLRDATISIEGQWDNTASTGADAVLSGIIGQATTKTFEFGPDGNLVGRIRYAGECFLTSYNVSSPVGDVTSFTAEFQVTDLVTRNTF